MSPSSSSREEDARARWVGLALLAAITAAYWPSLWAGFIGYDDPLYVSTNPMVLRGLTWEGVRFAFTSFSVSNWHPLTWLSYMLDSQFYITYAPGYRITNLILHWGNSLLLFLLLRGATQRFWEPALVAALFALHPQHVESVAWISERKDVLSALFWFLSMYAYLGWTREGGRGRYLVSLALFALGCMAKQMLVTLPFALLLFDFWPLRRFGPGTGAGGAATGWRSFLPPGRLLLEKVPFLVVSAAASVVAILAQEQALAPLTGTPLWVRGANALVSWLEYLRQTILPYGLAIFYPHPGRKVSLWLAGLAAVLFATVLVLAVRQARTRPWLLTGWLWFLGVLVPVLGLVQVGSQSRADRYVYIPHVGLFLIAAWGLAELAGRLRLRPRTKAAAALACLAGLGFLTFRQAGVWTDTLGLFLHATQVTEHNAMAHLMVATNAGGLGKLDLFREHYQKAVDDNPKHVSTSHVQWGYRRVQFGDIRGGMADFVQALEIDPRNSLALLNLAQLQAASGRLDVAEYTLHKALDVEPGHPILLKTLANLEQVRDRGRASLAGVVPARADNATRPSPSGGGQ